MIDRRAAFAYLKSRLTEPSTYAGLSALCLSASEIAEQAKCVAQTAKTVGPFAGVLAAISAVEAIRRADKKRHENVVDTEYTVVEPKDKTDGR